MSKDNILKIRDFSIKDFIIELRDTDDKKGVVVRINGFFNLMHPDEVLKPYIEMLHDEIIKKQIKKIELHFEEFTSLNSSTLKVFVYWFDSIRHLDNNEMYTVKFIYDSEIPWQKSFFPVVEKLLPKLEPFDIN